MKKIIAILLAMVMLLSLTACGGQEPEGNKNTPTTTKSSMEQMAGKYMIYHAKSGDEELNYFQVRVNTYISGTYLDLRADGSMVGLILGIDMPEGCRWDAKEMGIYTIEDALIPIEIQGNELTVELNGITMTLLKEGDSRLNEELPNMFDYLRNHVRTNGTQDAEGHTVVIEEKAGDYGHLYSLTVTADNKIFVRYRDYENTVTEMELVENAQFQTATMPYNAFSGMYLCTATIETAVVNAWDFQLSSFQMEPEYDNSETIQGILSARCGLMLSMFDSYLQEVVGINMTLLGFANYYTI